MTVTRILRIDAVGETLAAAFCGEVPVGLLVDLWDEPDRLRLGQVLTARLAHVTPDGRGAFLETGAGETVYMETAPPGQALGARLSVRVAAEARRGKQARVTALAAGATDPETDAFAAWRAGLPGGRDAALDTAAEPDRVHAILETALAPDVPLPGGGRISLTRTPALTAVDVDTAGRQDRGRAGERAMAVNLAAARALGHQLALRGLGGLVVLDCIAPVTPPARRALKPALIEAFRTGSTRKIAALAPSPFGLLEASLAWGPRPVDEAFLDAAGQPLPRTRLLDGLRALEREARARPAARLTLKLPESAYAAFKVRARSITDALDTRYGARLAIAPHARETLEISHADTADLPRL